MKTYIKTILWVVAFAIAMGFLESAVVIYLREIYYPDGFEFPLVIIPKNIAVVEFWREVATIVMLAAIGVLVGKTKKAKWAYFIIAFAVWDIFYYVFLYVFIQWPQSLFTWDILFLIPVPWVGPVLAPCLVALQLFIAGIALLYLDEKNKNFAANKLHSIVIITGLLIIIISFMLDYVAQVSSTNTSSWTLFTEQDLFQELKTYVPQYYNWWLFILGNSISLFTFIYCFTQSKKSTYEKSI